MKIAKRALAIIMAVALVGCMSAMAFAAGSVSLSYDGEKNIAITANGMVGLKSFDFTITADDGVVIKNVKDSSASDQCKAIGNAYTYEFNKSNGQFSGYFKEELWSAAVWNEAADDMGEDAITFDPASFNMGTIVIDASGATGPAYVSISGSVKGVDGTVSAKVLVKEGAAPSEVPSSETPAPSSEKPAPSSEKPAPSTEKPAPSSEKPSQTPVTKPSDSTTLPDINGKPSTAPTTDVNGKPTAAPTTGSAKPTNANPSTGNVDTGDNMALAAAAGIVVLAGAAFVISKKRK